MLQKDQKCVTACRCTSRLSIALSAGKNYQKSFATKVQDTYGNININTIQKLINTNAHTAFHKDPRDIGAGGTSLFCKPFLKSGIDIVGCDERIIQFITVISKNINHLDSIFGISMTDAYPVFTMTTPYFDEEIENADSIRCTVYGLDYSNVYHGNISEGLQIDDDAWALRITSYVTVHASSWNNWVKKVDRNSAYNFLKMVGGMK